MLSSVQRKCISLFTRWLDYYGKVFNKVVIAVPLQYTTQECSGCGYLVKKTLSARTHQCPQCGLVMERPTACWHYQDVNYSQLKQGAFSSPAVSKPTVSLWGGLQHPQSTVTSALNNRFWCPQYNYNLRQLKLLKELSSSH